MIAIIKNEIPVFNKKKQMFSSKRKYFLFGKFIVLMLFVKILFLSQILFFKKVNAYEANSAMPMVTDDRFKHFVFNENEIFKVTFRVGYQSVIELQEGEEIAFVIFGDRTPWKFKAFGRKLFLKTTVPGVETNMIIYTNKRRYFFEISSSGGFQDDKPIAYTVDFYYPNINVDVPPTTTKLAKIALNKMANVADGTAKVLPSAGVIAKADGINTNYTYATAKGSSSKENEIILPIVVFDNGDRTYFKFKNNGTIPIISAVDNDFKEIPLRVRKSGDYVYVETVRRQLTLRSNKGLICLFNENKKNKTEIAYKYK